MNPDKTEELLYTAYINCMTDADSAYLQMQLVYDQFDCDHFDSHLPLEGEYSLKNLHIIPASPDTRRKNISGRSR